MVDMGASSNIMKSPLMLHDNLGHPPLIRHLSNRGLVTELDLITVFDVITLFREVSKGHVQQVRLANRGSLFLRTPGPVQFGTCICSNVETILSRNLSCLRIFGVSNIPQYFYLLLPKERERETMPF